MSIHEEQLQNLYDGYDENEKQLFLSSVMARASYNKYRGWDVFNQKVVKYAYVEKDGAVMRANGYCVGNHESGDFLLHVPQHIYTPKKI